MILNRHASRIALSTFLCEFQMLGREVLCFRQILIPGDSVGTFSKY